MEDPRACGAWADPDAGVWFNRWWTQSEGDWSEERCKAEILKGWGKGGWLQLLVPILRDSDGRIWFLDRTHSGSLPYFRFDGRRWLNPVTPKSCRAALPRIMYRNSLSYSPKAVESPDGAVVLFEDLGALAFQDGKFIYGSFYDYSTCDYPRTKNRIWPAPSYLRNEPRWAFAPDGTMLVWGDPRFPRHLPDGVMLIQRWNGQAWQSSRDFRGIPAQRLRHLFLLDGGAAWAFVRPEKDSWRALPVFLSADGHAPGRISPDLQDEDGRPIDWSDSLYQNAYPLFQHDDTVYASMAGRFYALLPNGRCRALGDPWPKFSPTFPFDVRRGRGPNVWILGKASMGVRRLFLWNERGFREIDTGLGRGMGQLCGEDPDGRVYMTAGRGERLVVSILPGGRPNPSVLEYEPPDGPILGRHVFDNQGRMTARWGPGVHMEGSSWRDPRNRWHRLGFPWQPTHVFDKDGWHQVWVPKKPPPLFWQKRSGPPPRNLLERACSPRHNGDGVKEFVRKHYDEILRLLREPDAPYYRHSLGYLEPGFVLYFEDRKASLFDGRMWRNLADHLRIRQAPVSRDSLFMRGERELWWRKPGEEYRCLDIPARLGSAPRLKHVVRVLEPRSTLGVEGDDTVWDLGIRGPRKVASIDPSRLESGDRNINLRGVDEHGRVYHVHKGEGTLTVSDGKDTWRFTHRAFDGTNYFPSFALGPRGRIWSATVIGLLVLSAPQPGGGDLELLALEPRGSEFNNDELCFDRSGNLWVRGLRGWRYVRNCAGLEFSPQ